VAKSCGATAQLSIDKDINIVRRVTSPLAIRDVMASLHESPTPKQHSVEGQTFLEVAARTLSSVDFSYCYSRVTRGSQFTLLLPPLLPFGQDLALRALSRLRYR